MARQSYVVMKMVSAQPDGPDATCYRFRLRGAVKLGDKEQYYGLSVIQHAGRPVPYEDGAQIEMDDRLVDHERGA